MRIALDYDDTYTNDSELWHLFVGMAISRGHSVAFVTSRREDFENTDVLTDARTLGIPVVFCGHKAKADCYKADVWIDDSPLTIPSVIAMKMATLGQV